VNQRIFLPLQMHNASVGMGAFLAARNRAQPHTKINGEWKSGEVKPNYYRALPAAGVNASANDLGKWLIAQMGYKPEVIPPQLIDEVTQARVRTQKDLHRKYWRDHLQDAHYGLGWRIYRVKGEELFYHAGWVQGFVAEIAYSKSRQIGLAILLNAESNVIGDIGSGFWAQLLASEPPPVNQLALRP
jgi:beta-lactamase class C